MEAALGRRELLLLVLLPPLLAAAPPGPAAPLPLGQVPTGPGRAGARRSRSLSPCLRGGSRTPPGRVVRAAGPAGRPPRAGPQAGGAGGRGGRCGGCEGGCPGRSAWQPEANRPD